ncbi:MAG: GIY-YIG nuclease family protein, partial [Clostridia bacterium]|nr:GIY-YIG nuclease family protein [Clostridia bacterium]
MADERLSRLLAKARRLPLTPGVYIMKNAAGKIIYIGKAKKLQNRVSQYFGTQNRHAEKVRQMVENVEDFDYILCDNEFEALVLECSLIKQNMPKYNILLKDAKGFHYIRVTPPPYTTIKAAKMIKNDGAEYLGPYYSSYVVKRSVDAALKTFKLP